MELHCVVFRLLPTTQAEANKTCPQSWHIEKHFTHVCLHVQTAVGTGDLHAWQITVILIMGKPNTPIEAPTQEEKWHRALNLQSKSVTDTHAFFPQSSSFSCRAGGYKFPSTTPFMGHGWKLTMIQDTVHISQKALMYFGNKVLCHSGFLWPWLGTCNAYSLAGSSVGKRTFLHTEYLLVNKVPCCIDLSQS